MKKERKALYFSILINFIVSFLKICSGLVFGSFTIIADGYYSICDLMTDFISLISAKVAKKRANKKFPFGYGKIEYICEIMIGLLIIIVSIIILFQALVTKFTIPDMNILFIIILVVFLKTLSSNYLYQVGKEIRSQILIASSEESFMDVVSSTGVLIIVLFGQFFPGIDLIGSLIISFLIFREGIKIIRDNLFVLIGEDKNDQEIKQNIKKIINKNKNIKYSDTFLIKSGSYFQATIELAVNEKMKVKDLIKKETQIKYEIKQLKYNIKYIDFEIVAM